jgi:hypothetical protein
MKLLIYLAITALAVGYNVLLVSQGPALHKAIHGPDVKVRKSAEVKASQSTQANR